MGWFSTFVGIQASKSFDRLTDSKANAAGFAGWMSAFQVGYQRRVVKGSLLSHPEVQQKISVPEWDKDLSRWAVSANTICIALEALWVIVGGMVAGSNLRDVPPEIGVDGTVYDTATPLSINVFIYVATIISWFVVWYGLKAILVKTRVISINNQFSEAGWNINALRDSRPAIEDQRAAEERNRLQAQQEAAEAARRKRKFGNPPSS